VKRILLLDDHPVTRHGIVALCQEALPGAEVIEVGTSDEVVARVDEAWDLMLLDIVVPGTMGFMDLLAHVRERAPGVPALVVTMSTDLSYTIEALRAGASGIIHKHRTPDEFVDAIRIVAAGGRYLHPETALAIAGTATDRGDALPHEKLSKQELAVLLQIARGLSVKEIGGQMGISEKTVATYLRRIRQKSGLGSAVEITRYAMRHRLVD